MKATDLTPGVEYAQNDSTHGLFNRDNWRSIYRVEVIEAPVEGWQLRWRYGYASRQRGKVDVGGRKDHALVRYIYRDWEAERTIKFETFEDLAEEAKNSPTWDLMDDGERQRRLTEIMDSIKVDEIWKRDREDRVSLRSIKMTWAEYQDGVQSREQAQEAARVKRTDQDERLAELSNALPDGITIQRSTSGYTGLLIRGGNLDTLITKLEDLLA